MTSSSGQIDPELLHVLKRIANRLDDGQLLRGKRPTPTTKDRENALIEQQQLSLRLRGTDVDYFKSAPLLLRDVKRADLAAWRDAVKARLPIADL